VVLTVCSVASIGAFGCNTFMSFGSETQTVGQATEKTADNSQIDSQQRKGRRYNMMAIADSGGLIRPSGGTRAPYGSSRTYLIEPYDGYRVADVFVDGSSVGPLGRYTFDRITSSHTISALFTVESSR